MKNFWSYDLDDALKELNSSRDGLTSQEAAERIETYGKRCV